jgi:hypothetical protein
VPRVGLPLPAPHVESTGVRRPGFANRGRRIILRSNHVEVELNQGTIYHYDGACLSSSYKDKLQNLIRTPT